MKLEGYWLSAHIRPLGRGIVLRNDDPAGNTYLDDWIEEALGKGQYSPSGGSTLYQVHIIVEWERAEKG